MKLLSLNSWGALQGQLYFDFIAEHAETTDIFCLQEVFSAGEGAPQESLGARMFLHQELEQLLPNFTGYFEPKSSGYNYEHQVPWPVHLGLSLFVKKSFAVSHYAVETLFDSSIIAGTTPVEGLIKLQITTVGSEQRAFHVVNIHGISRPGDKLDTPERLLQSEGILRAIAALPPLPVIVCGDFNLMPETKSIALLEQHLRNLIADFHIENTRNEISWKRYKDRQSFADYTFVSKEVAVSKFEVPYNLVSDHLPMILDFTIQS